MSEEKKEEKKDEKKDENSDFENITEDGGVKKKIIKEGSGAQAAEGNEVKVNYIGRNGDKIFDQTKDNKPYSFKIGAHSVIKGWEVGVKTMKIGEKAEFIFSPDYAYGKQKVNDLIPENSTLNFEIELLEIVGAKKEISDMEYEEKVAEGKKLKEEGIEKFKQGDYAAAREKWDEACKYLDHFINKHADYEKEGCDLYQSVLSNLCNCCNKQKEYYAVIIYANKGIKVNDQLPKLFYFRAIANAQTAEFEKAEKDVESLEKLLTDKEKENAGLDRIRYMIKNRREETNNQRKKFSKNLLSNKLYEEKDNKNPVDPPEESNPENPVVFMDIKIGSNEKKRVQFELFKDKVPTTSENFRCLCTGEKKLTYKGSVFHRVVKGFAIEGGDYQKGDGTGGQSVYGEKYTDETFYYGHTKKGLLCMTNFGKNKFGSQFFITLRETSWFNGKHIVFGRVIKGMEVIEEMENIETDGNDIPQTKIVIENCGELKDSKEIDPEYSKVMLKKQEEERKKREEERKREREEEERKKKEEDDRNKVEELISKGNEEFQEKNYDKAISLYQEAININPKKIECYLNLGKCHLEKKDYIKSIELCKYVCENTEDLSWKATAFGILGYSFRAQNKLDEALKAFEYSQLETNDPIIKEAYRETKELKEKQEAEAYINPEIAEIENLKANELYRTGKFSEALKVYEEAIKRNPKLPKYYTNRAQCNIKLMEFNQAIKDCETAIKIEPKTIKAYQKKANCHFITKEYNKVLKTIDDGMKFFPNDEVLRELKEKTILILTMN